jgi:hypothetical protein
MNTRRARKPITTIEEVAGRLLRMTAPELLGGINNALKILDGLGFSLPYVKPQTFFDSVWKIIKK